MRQPQAASIGWRALAARRTGQAAALLLAGLGTAGCTLMRLHDETTAFDAATVLVGRVELGAQAEGSIVVGAYARSGGGWRLEHQTRLHEHGGYELIVGPGTYTVFAFADRNGNGLHDRGEPAAERSVPAALQAQGHGLVAGLDLVLDLGTDGSSVDVPRLQPAPRGSTQAGAPADLDAPELSAERGRQAYWQPLSFFRAQGGNILFVEPYDPARTPVLFVHGAAGSPQDWRHQIDHLDRSRFQAWVYFYPSGAPVESASHLLYWKLLNLQLRTGYERLQIVAHSMGGLVVRRFLLDSGANLPQIRRFVSLSTPWAGEPSAVDGVKLSPAVVPSWRDLQPDGPFMRSLFDRRLPPGVEYDLLFGHRGAPGLWRPNNDGTVTLASQLRDAAQREARLLLGYDESHTSILSSPQVTAQLQALLRDDDAAPGRAGRLDVALDYGAAPRHGLPLLVLQRQDRPGDAVTVALSAAAGGGRIAALAPGRYRAGLLAPGFAATPAVQDVDIGPQARRLAFRLQPQGSVNGYVGARGTHPAGSLHPPAANPRLTAVTLRAPGFERRLWAAGDDAGALGRLIAGQDQAWGSTFFFVGVPAGAYELEVEAAGFQPYRTAVQVVPGDPGAIAPILLEPR